MEFVSTQQMIEDVRNWSAGLPPDLVAVAGIPRSGILPASHLALHRNIHLVTVDDLLAGRRPWECELRRGVRPRADGKVMILDDSINSGATIHELWSRLRGNRSLVYGALYHQDADTAILDHVYRRVPAPRCFEWNLFHCRQMLYSCLDLDGVICEDWLDREEDSGPGLDRYLAHVESAQPRFLPTTYEVLAIVTSRLEKYRAPTERWLASHNVKYRELVMSPFETAAERRAAGAPYERKAAHYASLPEARLFIESDPAQAQEIARTSRRPVLCAETMELIREQPS